jgi:hypothetical protein
MGMIKLKKFLEKYKDITDWTIISDYCLNDASKKDTFVFTLCPLNFIKDIDSCFNNVFDLKHVHEIADKAITILKQSYCFTIALVFDNKKAKDTFVKNKVQNIKEYFIKSFENSNTECKTQIIRKLNEKQNRNSLLNNIYIITYSLAYITEIMCLKTKVNKLVWLPDRDETYIFNHNMLKEFIRNKFNIPYERKIYFGCPSQSDDDTFSNVIRFADYMCGALSSIYSTKDKHITIYENVLANNDNCELILYELQKEHLICKFIIVKK